jgi:FixJ family two-component response regulator
MQQVLVIDDDRSTLEGFAGVLRYGGFDVATAETGREGLSAVQRHPPDLVLADLGLPDLSGVDLLRELRAERIGVPLVIVTGFGSTRLAVEAIRAGACDFVEKPLVGDDLLRVVERALARNVLPAESTRPRAPTERAFHTRAHAAARWAHAVARLVDAPTDPRTLEAWGHYIGASPGTIKNWCRIAGLSPRRSLTFARLLRAVVRHRIDGYRPADVLDIVDLRTLARLLQLGGAANRNDLPNHVDDFLASQRLIRDTIALREVEQALRALEFRRERPTTSY